MITITPVAVKRAGRDEVGVVGVVIDGACLDSHRCNVEQLTVWCTTRTLNHVYGRLANGGVNVPIECAGVSVRPGDIVCGDDDGVLVVPREHAEKLVGFAQAIHAANQQARARRYQNLGLPPNETLGKHGG